MNRTGFLMRRDEGWTFIEATLAIVLMAIMVLGLTIVLLAFREHLDRSWAVRTMDQYGNDVIEELTHSLRNAVDVSVRHGAGDTDVISIQWADPWNPDLIHKDQWDVDRGSGQVKKNHVAIDKTYPPRLLSRGESFQIDRFRLFPYGGWPNDPNERADALRRNASFNSATYTIQLKLVYTRAAINPGDKNWTYCKIYDNKVYMRNKNLVMKKGITG